MSKPIFRHERRQSPRTAVLRPARLSINEWSRISVDVGNISRDGFNAKTDVQPLVGTYVTLGVPGIGRVEARVVWRDGDGFGAKFARPLDLSHCAWTNESLIPVDEPAADEVAEVARLLASRVVAPAKPRKQQQEGASE